MDMIGTVESIKNAVLAPPPCISIYVDKADDNENEIDNAIQQIETGSGDPNDKDTKIAKCKSMHNMKLAAAATANTNDTKKTTTNNTFAQPMSTLTNSRHRYGMAAANTTYRKCLSRVNLNLYQNNNNSMVHSSSQQNQNSSALFSATKSPKLVKLNPGRGFKVRNFPINAVSIMNLENCVDNLDLESTESQLKLNSSTGVHSSRRNLLINKSYSNLSNNFLKRTPTSGGATTTLTTPSSYLGSNCCILITGGGGGGAGCSSANMFKSSTSLNALLDLDLMESVSVGSSFDRLSLYSDPDLVMSGAAASTATSDSAFYVRMIDNNTNKQTESNINNKSATSSTTKLRTSNISGGELSLLDPTMSLSKENRVIDWLEHI